MVDFQELDPGTPKERQKRAERSAATVRVLSPEAERTVELLRRLLADLEEAGDPLSGSPIGAQMRVKRADSSKDEGANTRWARRLQRKVMLDVRRAVSEFEARVDGSWKPVPKERGRCWNRRCPRYSVSLPVFVEDSAGSRVELTHCVACGGKLSRSFG